MPLVDNLSLLDSENSGRIQNTGISKYKIFTVENIRYLQINCYPHEEALEKLNHSQTLQFSLNTLQEMVKLLENNK